jgi:uncharacterized delta-60 repeat protein
MSTNRGCKADSQSPSAISKKALARLILNAAIEPLEARQLLSGDLDLSFGGGDGFAVQDFGGVDNYGSAAAVMDGSKILVTGTYGNYGDQDVIVSRHNSDGSLDTSFGTGGYAIADLGSGFDAAKAIAVQSDGKILVAGYTDNSANGTDYDMAVVRFNADGSLDNSFGTGGVVLVDLDGSFDVGNSLAVQANGQIIVGGTATMSDTFNSVFAMARLNADGSLDVMFDGDGKVTKDLSTDLDYYFSASLAMGLVGEQIVLAGYATTDFVNNDVALAWFNVSDGSFDHAEHYDWGRDDDTATAMAVTSDGKLVVAGYSHDGMGVSDFAVMRLLADGSMDASFNGGSVVRTSLSGGHDSAHAVMVDVFGNVIVAGKANGVGEDFGLVRYLSDGSLDAGFGANGIVRVNVVGTDDAAYAVLQPVEGKLVVVGTAASGGYDAILVGLIGPVSNVDPVANPGGPYSVEEGGHLLLSGAGSSDVDGTIAKYEWDFDFDGSSFDVDAEGACVEFARLDGPVTRTVALRVTDDKGAVHVMTTTVSVYNSAPVASMGGMDLVQKGRQATFVGWISDFELDTHMVKWDFGDGTVTEWMSADADGALNVSHAFDRKGTYTVTLTVCDDDGAHHSVSMVVTVKAGHVFYDAAVSSLVLEGTTESDSVMVLRSSPGMMEIVMNGVSEGEYEEQPLMIFGTDGDDLIVVTSSSKVMVYGGYGNDTIFGGMNDATLYGEAGNDHLFGGLKKNLLDGGDGNDHLKIGAKNSYGAVLLGGAGNDVLIGGAGDDVLDGGEGNDKLKGRKGMDMLNGGMGKDHYADVKSGDMVEDADEMKKKAAPKKALKAKAMRMKRAA